jgi:hypothetical protein
MTDKNEGYYDTDPDAKKKLEHAMGLRKTPRQIKPFKFRDLSKSYGEYLKNKEKDKDKEKNALDGWVPVGMNVDFGAVPDPVKKIKPTTNNPDFFGENTNFGDVPDPIVKQVPLKIPKTLEVGGPVSNPIMAGTGTPDLNFGRKNASGQDLLNRSNTELASMMKRLLKGGKSKGVSPKGISEKEKKRGIEVEYEHTPDREVSAKIRDDHHMEGKDYYKHLDKMEDKMTKKKAAYPIIFPYVYFSNL